MAKTRTPKSNGNGALGFEAQLWAGADKMRGHMDASEYKHVCLGLIFLKYISDAFEEKREQLLFGFSDPKSDWFIKDEPQRADAAGVVDDFANLGRLGIGLDGVPAGFGREPEELRGGDKLNTRFLRYLISSREFTQHIHAITTGTAVPHISGKQIKDFRFLRPPLPEQRAIASILGSLDDKIELNRRMNETLEALAQTLFKSWFTPAFRSLGAGTAAFRSLGAGTAAFRSLGEGRTQSSLPKGWTERSMYDCVDYINGAAFRNEHFSADRKGLPVIKIGELKNGISGQTEFCDIEREEKYRINSGDVLFSWSGSPDTSINTFLWTEGEGWLNQHIFKIQFKRPIEKFFVYYLLKHLKPEFIEMARHKQTTGLGHVTAQDLKRMKTPVPPRRSFAEVQSNRRTLYQKVYSNLHESRTLAALRDALLPKLLSGELGLKNG